MRITIVTETYAPQVNGVSRTLDQLARFLRDSGDEVQLIHPDYGLPPDGPDDLLTPSVRVPFYPEVHLPLPVGHRLARALGRFRPDLVHIATEATLGLAVLRLATRRGIPVVSSFHTNFDQYSAHYRVGWSRGIIWRYLRWFHNRTIETYVPSLSTIGALEGRGFRNLVLWPRGVDASAFRPDRPGREAVRRRLGIGPDDVVIAYVGRLAAEKNIDYLAAALAEARRRCPNARPLIVGDGPEREPLEARLGGLASFVGFRQGDDLADHYAAADLFAFASTTETFGNVVLEAMASGLPAVVLAAGGPAELVRSGENGEAIPPDAPPSAFADALASLIADRPRRLRMAAAARAFAQEQSWEAIMGALRLRYLDAAGAAPLRPMPEMAKVG